MRPMDANEYPWYVKCHYAEHVGWPKVPGALAIETKHATEHSRDLEIRAADFNDDIGEVIWGRR